MFSSEEKKHYMELAFAEAEKAEAQDEVPIGAIVVAPDGQVIGRGYNRRELDNIATHHAEILAINEACKNLNSWRLIDCSLFVTLEPCAMCAGAIINARLKEVFYGAPDHKAGASGSVVDLFAVEKFNHHPQVIRGLYSEKASNMLTNFFRAIRAKQKEKKLKAKTKENDASPSQID
ncbi:tRNA adenosine(34) deaminase TadA [Lactobacillus jensenii]|jgi:tRNA-specific adenosine deaminase|uniref:tRNA-specific adenosine deaminase n=2 Tax=Lactobacillus TaxID=1578 RepID=A0A5N1IB04_LACJE|nr:tRNA adenosine(34) deaminase TadA [Lactobacillus jensenii]APT14294.1 tRNA-specific adenosine deaminase [Lactobacillus jensenii]EEQ24350.1 cytidine and deoxycytidylate deaminase zinc-binding region [Lactobacillus jensenii 269-3]EEX27376.1 cytidine and deoxycytidylate deaminase zinc-binding region [Lactobacillus jensenii SJ-7A-US]KAA9235386.1 nucleoside deaminase [Lactobacillus jensenii]KAA9257122.1 nucleoside deaminase [Lactobacillus jensenii]